MYRNSTVADVARKVMGDAPIAYIEGAGGTRVAEDQIVAVRKNDVSAALLQKISIGMLSCHRSCLSKSDDSTRKDKANAKHTQPLSKVMHVDDSSSEAMLPSVLLALHPAFPRS